MRVSQELRQQMSLTQVIEFSNLLAIPDEVLSTVALGISYNPASVEAVLRQRREQGTVKPDTSGKVQSLYAHLTNPQRDADAVKELQGVIFSPEVGSLENCLGKYSVVITPDVTYVGRKDAKPEMVLSDHLKGSLNLQLAQLEEAQYPETSRLLARLQHFDEWKRRTLRSAYVIIGEVQREFLEDLDNTRYHIFKAENLAEKLQLHESTVSRLLSNRWVEARSVVGDQKVLYAKDMLVTNDGLKKYLALKPLNNLLLEEFERKKAYSDRELTEKVRGLARRTIAKYRLEAGVPGTCQRNEAYKSAERTEPYKLD